MRSASEYEVGHERSEGEEGGDCSAKRSENRADRDKRESVAEGDPGVPPWVEDGEHLVG